jgi:phage terminase Nu1 subunit (DNA packaging protein)
MTMTEERPRGSTTPTTFEKTGGDVVRLPRRTIDKLLVAIGLVAAIVFAAAGAMLMWGSNFAEDYVHDELASQNVVFSDADSLREEGRDDLVKYADEQVTTGTEAEAYASYIGGHLEGIADGKTYAEIDDRGAAQAVVDARESGASEAEIAELQATANELRAQRDTLFRGETLRGLLLSSYAWATVGAIAGIAAYVAFAGAAVLLVLVVAGVIHLRRMTA